MTIGRRVEGWGVLGVDHTEVIEVIEAIEGIDLRVEP